MDVYHKIQTVFKRDPENKFRTLLNGQYSLPEFDYLKNNKWVFTEKIDGTNIRVKFRDRKVTYGGKTDNAQILAGLVDRLNEHFLTYQEYFGGDEVCLYGEGYGEKIQKGGKYRTGQGFVLFDVRVGNWWLKREDIEDVSANLSLEIAPIIGSGTLSDMIMMAKNGFDSQWGNFIAEGIVARPETELLARNGNRIITKIKHRDF